MASQIQTNQINKILRAIACSAVIVGPYVYTLARPEKTLKYRFLRPTDENGQYVRVDSSYNRLATEVAYRMKLPEQLRRSPKFDIRSTVHTGIEFEVNGHLTPIFDGVVYLVIPQWANLSSVEDLKKVKINVAGRELDFSHLDVSLIDTSKLKFKDSTTEAPRLEKEPVQEAPKETKSWLDRWFSNKAPPLSPSPASLSSPPPPPPQATPITRELVLIQKLIDTFYLSDEAKKYIIADQLETACSPWHMIPWFMVATSFFLPFSLYTRLRMKFQTRFQRFLFFHFLLLNGLLCFYLSPFIARLVNMQISRMRDLSTISYGFDLLDGGIEFLEKQLERNRILRELLPNGKDLFDPDGERTTTRVEIPYTGGLSFSLYHWSPLITYRVKRLRAKMENMLTVPEAEAKQRIFKKNTTNYVTDLSPSSK